MSARWPLVAALLVLAACSHATLPYQPAVQPPGARVSAAYQVIGDQLRVEIDTDQRQLEQAWIVKPDGAALPPQAIDNPPVASTPPPSLSIGFGGATMGSGGGMGKRRFFARLIAPKLASMPTTRRTIRA